MERLTNSDKEIPTLVDNAEYWLMVYFKLKDYENLEEQGRLAKLPCATGDKVYLIVDDKVFEREVDPMFLGVLWKEFNKSWFLTKSEAEAKLEELRGGKNE